MTGRRGSSRAMAPGKTRPYSSSGPTPESSHSRNCDCSSRTHPTSNRRCASPSPRRIPARAIALLTANAGAHHPRSVSAGRGANPEHARQSRRRRQLCPGGRETAPEPTRFLSRELDPRRDQRRLPARRVTRPRRPAKPPESGSEPVLHNVSTKPFQLGVQRRHRRLRPAVCPGTKVESLGSSVGRVGVSCTGLPAGRRRIRTTALSGPRPALDARPKFESLRRGGGAAVGFLHGRPRPE